MIISRIATAAMLLCGAAQAKDTVKIAFVGPLTGGNSAIGLGGRNSADLAVRLRNADAKSKYHYELVVLDDECKPDAGVQVATKAVPTGASSQASPTTARWWRWRRWTPGTASGCR